MTIERKGVNVLTAEIKAAKAEDGGYDIVLSMPTVDRDGEIVDAKAFDPLPPGRIPIDVDHGMTVLTTVGSGVAGYDGDVLTLRDFRFASTPLGKDVQTLVDEDHVSKMSVAFMDAKREVDEDDGLPHVRKAELLNAAIVAIPSNREASILAAKAAIALTESTAPAVIAPVTSSVTLAPGEFVLNASSINSPDLADTIRSARAWGAKSSAACIACGHDPTTTDPEETAAPAAVEPLADVLLAQAQASIASAHLTLLP